MTSPFSALVATIAGLIGFSLTYTALDISDPDGPPAIVVSDIRVWSDETAFYDRRTEDGEWLAWSGQILSPDGTTLICRGGGTSQYFGDGNPLGSKDVNWLVSEDCRGKIEAGQRFVFSWTPLNSDFESVRFPAEGFGTVLDAAEKPREKENG